ncbi:DUF2182 domain-containing protein [Neoroseomonas lacus]|uniref:DUF2182 domain-containing protein n=1 Tax=Neoroseomonas lacus TaxID=287609 RepID=A0A917KJG2_9PROT|nr:DUF2182 domain-containing protein [Neoroseomonas lacus]GGJ16519.1 hypothetical protein GCM10011320_24910 [Neoroseomonas lacus]
MTDDATGSTVLPRSILLALLVLIAAACWLWLLSMARMQDASMDVAAMGSPTMGLGWLLFLAVWVVMMVAMMFPAAAPMILTFHRVQAGRSNRGEAFVSTWVFVAGYMVVWTAAGLGAYAVATVGEALAARAGMSASTAARVGGGLLIAAGIYQLTPIKDLCLSKCRSPVGFIMTSWRDGAGGAFRMGLVHGLWCLGCCWLLFAILFPLGMMNITAMAALAALVFAEKSLALGLWLARGAAVGLVAYGLVVLAMPRALPTFPAGGGMGAAGMPSMAAPMTMGQAGGAMGR